MTRRPRSIDVANVGHKAPIPLGARVGGLICSSALSGKDPLTGKLPPDAETQVANTFANMKALLAAADATLSDVARITLTLHDERVRDAVNTHWLQCFPDPADRPARHIVTHELQHGMALQLELIAMVQPR